LRTEPARRELVPFVPRHAHQLGRQRFVEHSQHSLQVALVAIGDRAAFHVLPHALPDLLEEGKGCREAAPHAPLYLRYRSGRVSEPYIQARNLSKVYKSGTTDLVVFENLDLDVHRGEMLALVGESGAGKSTLLHLLGGLDSPSNGTIYYGGKQISGLARSEQGIFEIAKLDLFGRFTTSCRNSPRWKT